MMNISDALQLPSAHGSRVGRGVMRGTPEDFVVREWLGFEADNEGDHWLLTVRKRDANTHWVAKQIAKLAGIDARDVGYAGLKDRHALTEQAFTIPVRSAVSEWSSVEGDGFSVVRAQRHRRKLKRGALKGNDFEIVIRDFAAEESQLTACMNRIASAGVPNYFGPQRFGREGSNLRRASELFAGERIDDRHERGFALSAARSYLFNEVLRRRVEDGNWNQFIEGDVANLDGSNSIFVPEAIDATLRARCEQLDIHPTGPLWGRGDLKTSNAARAIEAGVAAREAQVCEGLAKAGLEQERRPLRLRVQSLSHTLNGTDLTLRFRLGRGAFATTVLHEILENAFDVAMPESDD